MRYYVRKEDLVATLNELTRKRNQTVVKVYKDVMMYRFSNHPQDFGHVQHMLLMPRRLFMCALHFALALMAICLLHPVLPTMESALLKSLLPGVLYVYAGVQLLLIYITALRVKQCYPYIVIDELLARKIIVLSPKSKPVQEIKAAEKAS